MEREREKGRKITKGELEELERREGKKGELRENGRGG